MRLIDADKLYAKVQSNEGADAYVRFHLRHSPTIDVVSREEYEELYRKTKEINEIANDILANFPSYEEVLSMVRRIEWYSRGEQKGGDAE